MALAKQLPLQGIFSTSDIIILVLLVSIHISLQQG